jgi:curved DNA-binding protein CbpA
MALPKMTTDPYAVLGIPNDAATAAIRSSYKKLILQCHPDKVKDESLREEKAIQFQKVQEAYELLIDSRRRRKYDEELVKQAKAAEEAAAKPPPPPQPQPQPMQTPHMAHAHPHSSHRSTSGPGPSPGSAERSSERTDRPRRERSSTNPSPDDRQKEKDRERHARKRAEGRGDRKSREESSWSQEERNMRKETQEEHYAWKEEARKFEAERERERLRYEEAQRYSQPQPQAPPQSHSRHPDEQPPKKGYNRYNPDGSPRKSSYDARQYEIPIPSTKIPPAAPIPPVAPDVRPGYLEAKKAEEERLAKVKAKMSMADEPIRPPVSEERGGLGASEKERERLERQDRERRERGGRDRDRDRGSEVPQHRERRSSKTPPILRRGSSVTSRCDEPSTPMMRPAVYGASAPTHNTSPYSSSGGATNYASRPRRHSSPSVEKQTSRQHTREGLAPCDSGYSSPSTDTPVADKKVPTPEMRTAAEG